jgi:hypothetical protein
MKGYYVVCQAIVNEKNNSLTSLCLLGSVNDLRMFRFLIYYFVQFPWFFSVDDKGQEGFVPFFVRRQGISSIVMVDDIA